MAKEVARKRGDEMTIVDMDLEETEIACSRIRNATSLISDVIKGNDINPSTKVVLFDLIEEILVANMAIIRMSDDGFNKYKTLLR